MYLLYLDDSGSVANANEEYLVLGGVSVFERRTYFLSEELDQIAEKYDSVNPSSVEFHASEVFGGKSEPWKSLMRSERQQAIKDVLKTLADDHYGTFAFAVAVHKQSFPNNDPMEVAFEELCNRFDIFLKGENAKIDKSNHHRGMIVLDESSYETTLQKLAVNFRKFGTRWGVTRNIAEVPLFVDSKASRIIQLADHVAYAVFRFYESNDMNYIKAILPKFHADSVTKKIHGLVHKQTFDLNCMCQACLSRR
jgi:hypothetical protein